MRDPYPKHGRHWSIWHPFHWSCRCGLDVYPCWVEQSWQRWRGGLSEARAWQTEQRRRLG
jgi:hypothetical protein